MVVGSGADLDRFGFKSGVSEKRTQISLQDSCQTGVSFMFHFPGEPHTSAKQDRPPLPEPRGV